MGGHANQLKVDNKSTVQLSWGGDMNQYKAQLEVAGPLAMFSRPDTGGTPTSYPAPTRSAAKAIFESIAMLRSGSAWIRPVHVELCKLVGSVGGEIKYQQYTTNHGCWPVLMPLGPV